MPWFYIRLIKKILRGHYLLPFNFMDSLQLDFFFSFFSAILIAVKISILTFSPGRLSFTPYLCKCSVQTVPKLFCLDEKKMQNINALELLPALVSPFGLGSLLDHQSLL